MVLVLARFGRYEILSLIGEGGMGQVFLAWDTRLPRHVALKTIPPDSGRDEESVRRLEQEAWTASSLNHPNIVTIYEVGRHGDRFFIAAEYIEGTTLREQLSAPLDIAAVLDIATQATTGLKAAHAAGIVHRDIKPENLMIRQDGLVKIVDFGLAHTVRHRAHAFVPVGTVTPVENTRPGLVLGTTRYMSPEQARGLPVDARTDIFSLGVVLYEMLSGRAPFDGETESDRIAAVLLKEPKPLKRVAPGVPAELARIVGRAMAKDVNDRYESAAELLADLQTVRQNLQPNTNVVGGRAARWLAPLGIGLAIACCVLLAILVLRWKIPPASSPRHPLSLAILPFRNLRPDPDSDFLGFSLADAIISKFGYISSVAVRPSSAIEKYRKREVDPMRAAADLKASELLTGSYLRDGGRLRINAQLIDAKQNRVLWQDTLDTPYQDLFQLQDRVAQQIIHRLQVHLSRQEAENLRANNPVSREAYEDYLRGVDLYAMNNFAGAIRMLEKSASLDPNYALTWAHLGQAYTTNASLEFGGRQQYKKAQQAYEKALSLNPVLIEARVFMANLFTDTGRVEQSVPLLRAALATNPNNAEAHWELGYAYRFAGLLPESLRECLLARQIDPEVKLYSSAVNSYLYLGEYDRFLASLPQSDTVYILFYKGFAEYYKRNYRAAVSYFDQAFDLNPSLFQAQLGEAFADSVRHRNADGDRLLRETAARVDERGVMDPEGIFKLAQAFAAVEDRAAGVKELQAAIRGGFFPYPYFVRDPLLLPLKSDRRFAAALATAQQRYEHFRATYLEVSK